MSGTRLPFMLEDLSKTLQALGTGGGPPIRLTLPPRVYEGLKSELENHFSGQLTRIPGSRPNAEHFEIAGMIVCPHL